MTYHFASSPTSGEAEIRLMSPRGAIPVDAWATKASDECLRGVDLAQRLIAAGVAIAAEDAILVEHSAIAGLSAKEAAALGLPPIAPAVAHVRMTGNLTKSDFGAVLEWRRPTGQPFVGAVRIGAFLRIGNDWWRLPDALFDIAEAVDALNSAGADEAPRYAAIGALREALPAAELEGRAQASGLAGAMTIAVADAFSLDLRGEGEAAKLIPILHRAGGHPEAPLLPEEKQRAFGEDQFAKFGTAKPVYAVGGAYYVVLSPVLKRALDVVRRTQSGSLASKRALMAAPRAVLRQALGDEIDETVIESLFRDTAAYSERVVGLGLWQKRVLPWIAFSGADWFGEGGDIGHAPRPRDDSDGGIVVGDLRIPLSPEEADNLREQIEQAIGREEPSVRLATVDGPVAIPATHETLVALQRLESARARVDCARGAADNESEHSAAPQVLIIRPNEDEIEFEGAFRPRPTHNLERPACLATQLKAHQEEGLKWLHCAYSMGRPGVLLVV